MQLLHGGARVAKLADARDLKSSAGEPDPQQTDDDTEISEVDPAR